MWGDRKEAWRGFSLGRNAMRWNFCGEGAEDGSCRIGAWRGSGGIGLAGFTYILYSVHAYNGEKR